MTDDGVIRAFLALEIPGPVRDALADVQRRLKPALPDARWVRPEGVHLTLKFLGERPMADVAALASDLAPGLAGTGAVRVELGGAGFFPTPRCPRVAWIGGRAAGIEPVVATVERVAGGHGWEPEGRPWSLHLTLARMRRPWPRLAVERYLETAGRAVFEPFTAEAAVLYRSTLGPGGARYDVVRRMPLT